MHRRPFTAFLAFSMTRTASVAAKSRAFVVVPLLVVLATSASSAAAQRPDPPGFQKSGPVIESGGQSVKVENPTFVIPESHVFKAVFVIDKGDTLVVNQQLNTVARFYNIHARHGVAKERAMAAAIFHGGGWTALLSDSAYGARFNGATNPSRRMVEELLANGAQLVLCGQTAGMRGINRAELLPGVKVAMSAMSALNYLQTQGYRYNPW